MNNRPRKNTKSLQYLYFARKDTFFVQHHEHYLLLYSCMGSLLLAFCAMFPASRNQPPLKRLFSPAAMDTISTPIEDLLSVMLPPKGFKWDDFRLSLIKNDTAYFLTSRHPSAGEDWRYHNPENWGDPYQDEKQLCVILPFKDTWLHTPSQRGISCSAIDINEGAHPWLWCRGRDNNPVSVMSGATIQEFVQKIEQTHGRVYFPSEWTTIFFARLQTMAMWEKVQSALKKLA